MLRAADWDGEPLDWWAFDAVRRDGAGCDGPSRRRSPAQAASRSSRLPSRLGFRGAPSIRYWEFEDGGSTSSSITAAAHETALMAVLQFAFVYGGDWSSVPIEVPVGSRVTVESVVVRDTFGMRTLVRPAGRDAGPPGGRADAAVDGHRRRDWVAASCRRGSAPVLEGELVEETMLLRDEQANLAWAVELVAPDAAGYPVPWTAVAPPPPDPPPSDTDLPPDRPPLHYRLATDVPRPLVPARAARRPATGSPATGSACCRPGSAAPPRSPRALLLRELADAWAARAGGPARGPPARAPARLRPLGRTARPTSGPRAGPGPAAARARAASCTTLSARSVVGAFSLGPAAAQRQRSCAETRASGLRLCRRSGQP